MKIVVRGGHTEKATGAVALLNELIEDRKVKDAVVKYLKQLGHEVLDVTPPANANLTISTDLAYGVDKANNWGAELFISIHFNKAYSAYTGAIGSEVCVYSKNDTAQRVVDGLAGLGFKNRGQKTRTELYELKNTKCKAMIVEVCFIEATEDVALYKKLGADAVGKKIAESIANKNVQTVNTPANPSNVELGYRVRITASVLNVRKGAGTNYSIATTVKKNDVYTIVEEKNGWGKLKSGVGFICLDYTQRL